MAKGERMKTVRFAQEQIKDAAGLLLKGELVAIPTETVYGLGANGFSEEAVKKIYEAKGRPSDNPLILHVPHKESIRNLVQSVSPLEEKLIDAFWPGPLTITFPKSNVIPRIVTGGLDRVALRCPAHALCREFLYEAGVPVAAPSANISGRPSPTTVEAVLHDMEGRIGGVLDGGTCDIGVESTVIECSNDTITILRPGGITREMLLTICDTVEYDAALIHEHKQPKAPGMKYAHYAPNGQMTTIVGEPARIAEYVAEELGKISISTTVDIISTPIEVGTIPNTVALIMSEETVEILEFIAKFDPLFQNQLSEIHTIVYGKFGDMNALAHALYGALLECNELGISRIYAEGCASEGLGVAIMNRMAKASSGNVIEV